MKDEMKDHGLAKYYVHSCCYTGGPWPAGKVTTSFWPTRFDYNFIPYNKNSIYWYRRHKKHMRVKNGGGNSHL